MTKLLENIFRSVNIALVNELAILADRMGIDIWEVVDAAATKPYGFMRFEPGPGMGGHCLPVDPVLSDLARARIPHVDRVHRARRQDQPADALPLRGADRARAQRRRQAGQGLDRSRSSASATRAASATSASRRRCGSSRCWPSAAPTSPTTTPTSRPSRSSAMSSVPLEDDAETPTRSCSSPPTRASTIGAIAPRRHAVRRSARGHPQAARREHRPALSARARVESDAPQLRARSSVGERSLHTREVAGSSPAVPITNSLQ